MIKKENRLNKKKDIENVLKNGKSFYNDLIVIKVLKNSLLKNRFCIIISAKISKKSVDRQKIRRRIKYIILTNKSLFKKGFDCLIMVKKDLSLISYSDLKNVLDNNFKKINLL
jgi:ribonuclease P protein component